MTGWLIPGLVVVGAVWLALWLVTLVFVSVCAALAVEWPRWSWHAWLRIVVGCLWWPGVLWHVGREIRKG